MSATSIAATRAAEHIAVPMATFICESGRFGCQNDRAEGKSHALAPSMFGLCVSTDLCQLSPEDRVARTGEWRVQRWTTA